MLTADFVDFDIVIIDFVVLAKDRSPKRHGEIDAPFRVDALLEIVWLFL